MGFMQEIPQTRKAPFFTEFRKNDWIPHFHWEASIDRVADTINQPHEDYPARIPATKEAILHLLSNLEEQPRITLDMLRAIHRTVFPDHGAKAGQWRAVNIQVADHIAPNWGWMDKLMEELEQRYWDTEMSIQTLRHWYYDFNTIHPLRDGNGRTGGITVAAISYHLLGIYLTPGSGP